MMFLADDEAKSPARPANRSTSCVRVRVRAAWVVGSDVLKEPGPSPRVHPIASAESVSGSP